MSFQWLEGNTELVQGANCLAQLSKAFRNLDPKDPILVFCGRSAMRASGLLDRVLQQLSPHPLVLFEGIATNPDAVLVQAATEALRDSGAKAIVAIGGGSVLDTAKAANVCALSHEPVAHICRNPQLFGEQRLCAISVAIPTTVGTGSEITPFSTIWDFDSNRKFSITGPAVVPSHVFLDPSLILSLPEAVLRATATDALGHAMESLWSKRFEPVAGAYAGQAIGQILRALPLALEEPGNIAAYEMLQNASFLAGLAISRTRTAAAHALSYPLTLRYGLEHGSAVGVFLPWLLALNLPFIAPPALQILHQAFGTRSDEVLVEVATGFLIEQLQIRPLKELGLTEADIQIISSESHTPGRMDNNIRELSIEDIHWVLRQAYSF